MESKSYWQHFTSERLGRRRALKGAAALGVGAAALSMIGCGGGGNDNTAKNEPADKSGLLSVPEDTTAQAKPGGVLKDFITADLTHADALISNSASTVNLVSVFAYPRLVKF